MKISKILAGLAILLFAMQIQSGLAQEKKFEPAVIAIIDKQFVLSNSKAYKEALIPVMKKATEELRAKAQPLEDDLNARLQDLKSKESLMDPEAFKSQMNALREEFARIQRNVSKNKAAMDKAFSQGRQEISQAMAIVVGDYIKRHGITLVLDWSNKQQSAVYLFPSELNISKDILAELDKSISSAKFEFQLEEL